MITIDAVKRIFNKDHYQLMGLSTDEKPTNVDINTLFLELDTGKFYYFDGTEWLESEGGGGGVSYEEVPYSDLKSAIDNGELKAGGIYRITDYVTKINGTYDLTESVGQTCYVHYAKSAEHQFDLIVTAIDESHLDEHAVAIQHEGDTYFANSKLTAWDILYTPENDPTKYSWADPNGNGVIYYMRDEFNNEAWYDFKNVMFLAYATVDVNSSHPDDKSFNQPDCINRYGSVYYVFQALSDYMQSGEYDNPFPAEWYLDFAVGGNILGTIQSPEVDATYLSTFDADWYYTFDVYTNGGNHIDLSLNKGSPQFAVHDNKFSQCYDAYSYTMQADIIPWGLPCNMFQVAEATVSSDFMAINNNKFGVDTYYNILDGLVTYNINLDEPETLGNIFGRNAYDIELGSHVVGCAYSSDVSYVTTKSSTYYARIFSGCSYIIIGTHCAQIEIGKYSESITIGDDATGITIGNDFGTITIDSGTSGLYFDNATPGEFAGKYHVLSGGYNNYHIVDNVNVNDSPVRYVGIDSQGQVNIWVPADGSSIVPITYAELVALKTNERLQSGTMYRITDYVTKINGTYDLSVIGAQGYAHYAKSAEHPFDLIVTALDASTLDEHASAMQHEGDTYFANSDLSAWDIKYTIENDPTQYSWADAVNGKGVIYYMKDENSNELPYDFKNVQYLAYALTAADNAHFNDLCYDAITQINRYGSVYYLFKALQGYMQTGTYTNPFPSTWNNDFSVGQTILGTIQFPTVDATYLSTFNADWYYTFDSAIGGVHTDISLQGEICYGNRMGVCPDALSSTLGLQVIPKGLPSTVMQSNGNITLVQGELAGNEWGITGLFNICGAPFHSNKFANVCNANCFGTGCYFNSLGGYCVENSFGNHCHYNTFEDDCYSNTFGSICESNTFGSDCYGNTFGGSCHYNIFGNNCYANTFGSDCYNNAFESGCNYNTFGNNCDSNTFGSDCYGNTFGGSCHYNIFGAGSGSNELTTNIVNCEFGSGVSGIILSNNDAQPTGRYIIQTGDYLNDNTKTTINLVASNTRPICVGKNSNGEVKQWTPADLVYPPYDGSATVTP